VENVNKNSQRGGRSAKIFLCARLKTQRIETENHGRIPKKNTQMPHLQETFGKG
jgi:hypothetical protein